MKFENGCKYDNVSGKICIYMNKPKAIKASLRGRTIIISGIKLNIDEFINRRGVTMLSFNGIIYGRFTDFKTTAIYLRNKITNEIQSLSLKCNRSH